MDSKVNGDRLVVKKLDVEDKSESGIVLYRPDATDPHHAEVIAVGDGTKTKKGKFIPSSLSVGDHIMYTHGAGTPIKLDGVEMVIIKEEDVLGWVDND